MAAIGALAAQQAIPARGLTPAAVARYQVFADAEQVARAAAEFMVARARQALNRHGEFNLALAGGRTPRRLYELLASPDYRGRIDWSRVWVYFTDERAVPPDHPDSNYGMIRAVLLDHVAVPAEQVARMEGEAGDLDAAAGRYARRLERLPRSIGNVPELDLVLLGLGTDGHTASLFPGSPVLDERERWVAAVDGPAGRRLTLTLPVLNHARELMFLVTGGEKADIVRAVLGPGPGGRRCHPVQYLEPRGVVHWYLDAEAARGLKGNAR